MLTALRNVQRILRLHAFLQRTAAAATASISEAQTRGGGGSSVRVAPAQQNGMHFDLKIVVVSIQVGKSVVKTCVTCSSERGNSKGVSGLTAGRLKQGKSLLCFTSVF